MFQVGDRVQKRYRFGDSRQDRPPTGTVVAISGRWFHVRHDPGNGKYARGVACRFDYLAEELEHVNPLLRFAEALGPEDRTRP